MGRRVELEPISNFLSTELGFPHREGRWRPERARFYSPVSLAVRDFFLKDLRIEDGTVSFPGGADSTVYDPQPIIDRPVGEVGDHFHTVRGGGNRGDIRVRSWLVGVVHVYVDGL